MSVTKIGKAEQQTIVLTQRLNGKVVIVTGASSGIGAATAREFARYGAQVVLAARRADELQTQVATITDVGGQAIAVQTDVSDNAQITRLVAQTLERFGHIDVLVNNAGIGMMTPYYKHSSETIQRVIDVNLMGAMLATRAVLPSMLERKQGAIISVASLAGIVAIDPLYSASKFGLRGFAHALRRQLSGSGISVSLVSPGYIRTSINRNARFPMPGPEVVARAIVGLSIKPRNEVIVPSSYIPLSALASGLPWLVDLGMRVMNRKAF